MWVGKTIVDPSWKRAAKLQKEVIETPNGYAVTTSLPEIKMTKVGMALQILPRYLPNGMIEVEVYPEISELTGRKRHKNVKITSLSAKVILKDGARLNIGGIINNKRKAYTKVFGPDFFKRKDIREVMNMFITAKALALRR